MAITRIVSARNEVSAFPMSAVALSALRGGFLGQESTPDLNGTVFKIVKVLSGATALTDGDAVRYIGKDTVEITPAAGGLPFDGVAIYDVASPTTDVAITIATGGFLPKVKSDAAVAAPIAGGTVEQLETDPAAAGQVITVAAPTNNPRAVAMSAAVAGFCTAYLQR